LELRRSRYGLEADRIGSPHGKIGLLKGQTGYVAARPRQGRDQAGADRIGSPRKHDWDGRGRLLYRGDSEPRRDNDIDLEPDQLGCNLGEALAAALRPANFDCDSATLDPVEFAQPLHKSGNQLTVG
jgi:hypothetical protein